VPVKPIGAGLVKLKRMINFKPQEVNDDGAIGRLV
jgi:hypothetical protein